MSRRLHFAFLNIGHFLDHFFMLIFATVAALALRHEWEMSYGELIPYATPGFIAFGLCALPAGWLADKWSRVGMMTIFFIGVGACSALTAFSTTPFHVGLGLFAVGIFAAIYHPVGIPLVIEGRHKTGLPIAVNGVYGNLGVGSAALITGFMIDTLGWRAAFVWPGLISIGIGIAYGWINYRQPGEPAAVAKAATDGSTATQVRLAVDWAMLTKIFAIVLITTALGGIVFQSTTFALPKVLEERLSEMAVSASTVGWYAFWVFALAALAQLVVGYLVDRHSLKFVFLGVAAMQVVFFGLMPGLVGWPALVVATAFMLATFGQIPINDVLVGRIARSDWRSRVFALRYIVTFTALATSLPLIAWIHANWGFDTMFQLLSVASMLIFVAVLALPRLRPALVPAE